MAKQLNLAVIMEVYRNIKQENPKVTKTVVWNLLTKTIKQSVIKDPAYGIHIHCPEAATPKDGPSAGGAITISILSLILGISVKNIYHTMYHFERDQLNELKFQ